MNAPLRRLSVAMLLLFALLLGNLTWVQFVRGDELRSDPRNQRVLLEEYSRQRGAIVVDGEAVASVTETDGRLKYLRSYPSGPLYAHVTGYKSPQYGESGVERSDDSLLSGYDDRLFVRQLSDLVTGRKPKGGNVVLTVNPTVQEATAKAMQGRKGAAIALDPRTGEVLSMVSGPSYDPSPLASHDATVRDSTWDKLTTDEANPMLNRAINQTYPPGSTFKVVVSAAAMRNGYDSQTQVPSERGYTPEQTTAEIRNFNGSSCGGDTSTLEQALTVSCNTAYAQLAVKLGRNEIRDQARAFGFETTDLRCPTAVSTSALGTMDDPPKLAQSGIGQRDVRMTPLQGAMIASAVANNGSLMRPYLVSEIQAPDFAVLDKTRPREFSRPMTAEAARQLQQMMRGVVEKGTGRAARISGIEVGGKTGTAEDGDARQDHEWFIGYAKLDGKPVAAVAVVLENAGTSSSQSAAIAATMMRTIVNTGNGR
ncbi:MAG: peptidoglycan D,D-transpeptidase FtsI family protein [Mycobacteriales bacterium]